MNSPSRTIEVDAQTAELLEARARARGMKLSEFLADIAANEEALPAEFADMRAKGEGPWSAEVLKEDARRLAEFERTRMAVPLDDVKAWVESWGTPGELPRPQARKL